MRKSQPNGKKQNKITLLYITAFFLLITIISETYLISLTSSKKIIKEAILSPIKNFEEKTDRKILISNLILSANSTISDENEFSLILTEANHLINILKNKTELYLKLFDLKSIIDLKDKTDSSSLNISEIDFNSHSKTFEPKLISNLSETLGEIINEIIKEI